MAQEHALSRRERQIMDLLYSRGDLSPAEIAEQLPDPPKPMAVRTMLKILMDKRLVRRQKKGRTYYYRPRIRRDRAGQSALDRVIDTFFDGSLDDAVAAYLARSDDQLTDEQYQRLIRLIREARNRGD